MPNDNRNNYDLVCWRKRKVPDSTPPHDKATDEATYMTIQKAAAEKTEIGWFNLLEGRMSKSWEVAKDKFY